MTSSAKNILFLVHRTPHPPNRGDRIRSYRLLLELAGRHNVFLATLADEPPAPETVEFLQAVCRRVAIVPLGGPGRWARAAWSLAAGRTATEGLFRSPALHNVLGEWASSTRFDAAVVYCSSMLPYLDRPEFADLPAVVDLVDVDSQKWFDYAHRAAAPKKWLFACEGRRLRKLERAAVARAAAVALVSEPEAQLLRSFAPNDRTHGIPNGVDLDYFRPQNGGASPWRPLPAGEQTDLAFVGALDYRANVDGLTWFVQHVWPKLRAGRPALSLGLVGRNPAAAVQKLAATPGVRVVGGVPDVRPYLAAAKAAIVPLRVARGIQNKVLEGLAMARPVIASPGAVEGLAAQHERELLVAGGPAEWALAVSRLLADAPPGEPSAEGRLGDRLGAAGRAFVESSHHWRACLAPFADLVDAAVRSPRLSAHACQTPCHSPARPARPAVAVSADGVLARE